MFCLIYRSVARPSFRLDDIHQLLKKARRKNQELGITGCLLYYRGEFIQYLEGNQIRVLELFDTIKKDKRHDEIELISFSERETREFVDWEMAFEDFYGENEQISYMRLLVETYLESPDKLTRLHPGTLPFWEKVSQLFDKSSQPTFP